MIATTQYPDGNRSHDPYPGLTDGIFEYQKYQTGSIFEGLGKENVGIFRIFYVNFVYIYRLTFL
jgi:hypothetical protein